MVIRRIFEQKMKQLNYPFLKKIDIKGKGNILWFDLFV